MAATACYSQVARALVLRYRSILVLYLLSVCLLPPSSGTFALVRFSGKERGAGPCTETQPTSQSSRLLLTSLVCECQQWLSTPSLDELQNLSLLFSTPNTFTALWQQQPSPSWEAALEQEGWSGHLIRVRGVCWDGHRKPARASGSFNLLPLHSSQSKHVCACDSHQSLGFFPPSWFSIHLRALVFLLLDSRPGMPNLGFEPLIPQGVSLRPNHHIPLLFSFLQAQALI